MHRRIAFILLFSLLPGLVSASHLIGGEISYRCMGNDNYEISLEIFRDCFSDGAEFDLLAVITIFDANNNQVENLKVPFEGSEPVPLTLNNPCLAFPPTLCIERTEYLVTVNLPPIAGGYTIVHQRCCRSPNLINVIDPQDYGSSYVATIPGPEVVSCNSMPVFDEIPPLAACIGVDLNIDVSATDPNGDSLVYELCQPIHGGGRDSINVTGFNGPAPDPSAPPPYIDVPWLAGYTTIDQINANPGLSITPQGQMHGVPTMQGKYLFGVCVKEYRNGVFISANRRDFQMTVVACDLGAVANYLEQDDSSKCTGLTFDFENLSINADSYFWDFGDPTSTTDTSTAKNPTYTYPDTGTYTVLLHVNKGEVCDSIKVTEFSFYHRVRSNVEPVAGQCLDGNSFDFVGSGEFQEANAEFLWEFGEKASIKTVQDTLAVNGVSYSEPGVYQASLTITETRCTWTDTEEFTVYPKLKPDFEIQNASGCPPLDVSFIDSSFSWQPLIYDWDFGNGQTSTDQNPSTRYTNSGQYTVTLSVASDGECRDTLSLIKPFAIDVHPEPEAAFSVDPPEASVFHPSFQFINQAIGFTECAYAFGDDNFRKGCDPTHFYIEGGDYEVTQIVKNRFGCRDTTSLILKVFPEFALYVPNAFTPNGDGKNEDFRPKMMSMEDYEFRIYNRWGQLIFQTNDELKGWDGMLPGSSKRAQDGVYVYRINGWDGANLREVQRTGHFTLLGGD